MDFKSIHPPQAFDPGDVGPPKPFKPTPVPASVQQQARQMNELTAAHYNGKIHPKHYILHGFTFLITLGCAIGADVLILDYLHNKGHRVQWIDGSISEHYTIGRQSLPKTNAVQMGVADDGRLVWRYVPQR